MVPHRGESKGGDERGVVQLVLQMPWGCRIGVFSLSRSEALSLKWASGGGFHMF